MSDPQGGANDVGARIAIVASASGNGKTTVGLLQAWYFSWRIATNDMTGISIAGENDEGLDHARSALLQPPSTESGR